MNQTKLYKDSLLTDKCYKRIEIVDGMEMEEGHAPDSPLVVDEQQQRLRMGRYQTLFMIYIRPCLAEMIATMSFVFVDVCSIHRGGAAFTHGFILFVNVAAIATVSGGHLNPAVTLAMTICGGLQPIVLGPLYVIAQLLGGVVGAALARVALTGANYDEITGGVHKLGTGVDAGQGILAEAVATSILVLVVLMVAFDENNKSVLAPLAIGLSVGGCIFAISGISGASLNPARSFGPALVRNYWKDHYVYWVGPLLGSLFSTAVYGLVLASPNRLWLYRAMSQ